MRLKSEVTHLILGTAWTAPGEGATLAELREFVGVAVQPGDERIRTNLRLTGQPCAEYDRERAEHVTLTVGR